MAAKPNHELILAQTLAAPFTPSSQGNPLSCRRLPEGGMVVIAADGRKLWFDAGEVAAAESELEEKQTQRQRAGTPGHRCMPVTMADYKDRRKKP